MIRHYTREAGVRTLERELAKVARKSLRQILESKAEKVELTPDNVGDFLGVRKFRYGMGEEEDQIGAVTGLAWTEVGGELLTIEAVTVPGKGQIKTTGKLGEVMQELIQAAMSFVKARAPAYGVKPSIFARKDIHVHLPEGAVPKDGPSAGIGMVTAMISTLTGIAVRRDVAMTGEVTLARPRSSDRRPQGKAACGASRRNPHRADPGREREGPRRASGDGEGSARDRARRPCRPGAGARAGRAAAADRMDRRGRACGRAAGSSARRRTRSRPSDTDRAFSRAECRADRG